MIRNLRKKFILVAMFSTLVVLAAIMGIVNISNYKEVLDRADEMTALLEKNDGKFPEEPKADDGEVPRKPGENVKKNTGEDNEEQQNPPEKPENDREHFSVETPFETRYFTVTTDKDGEVTDCDLDRIAAVNKETAEEYAGNVSEKSETTGFLGIYRYRVTKTEMGQNIFFWTAGEKFQIFGRC